MPCAGHCDRALSFCAMGMGIGPLKLVKRIERIQSTEVQKLATSVCYGNTPVYKSKKKRGGR